MADEFVKGFGILTIGFFGWMMISSWYTTEGFEGTQLIAPPPENLDVYGELMIVARDALFWFAILGAIAFWVVIPAVREVRDYRRGAEGE